MSSINTSSQAIRERIQAALGRWRGSISGADRELFEGFVALALDRIRGPYLGQHHPTQVLRHLEIAFEFARKRDGGAIKVALRPGDTKGLLALSNMSDQPFIVDSIRLFFRRHDAEYWGGFNLVLPIQRDASGVLIGVGTPNGAAESIVLVEADRGTLRGDLDAAAVKLSENLELARAMVDDFRMMTRSVERAVERFQVAADRDPEHAGPWRETAAFLQWLLHENFVFMGTESLVGGVVEDKHGIQTRTGRFYNGAGGDWPAPHMEATVNVRKGVCESPVHRAGRIDEILVRMPGQWDDQALFIRGMFTYRAVTQPSRNVPILRRILGSILSKSDATPGSFRYKGIANVFDSLPTEFLFTATVESIERMVELVFEAETQQEVGVTFLRLGPESAFCLVAMPKQQFSDELRRDLQREIARSIQASYSDHGVFVGRYETVLVHFYLTGVDDLTDELLSQLSARVRECATPWINRLWNALIARFDERTADGLADRYSAAFPGAWVRTHSAERTVTDIVNIEALGDRTNPSADLWLDGDHVTLRLYEPIDIYLTDILPVLNNFGLVVIDSYPAEVEPRGGHLRIDTFRLAETAALPRDALLARRDLLVEAIEAVFAGSVETDQLDALVVGAGLSWRHVDMIRGYVRYLRQLQVKVVPTRIREILLGRTRLVADLASLFVARFDPDLAGDRVAAVARACDAVEDQLRKIRAHDEDLIFGSLYALINATLRTNFYRTDRVYPYLSFKFDVQNSKAHPGASHRYEIYVHSKDVEGVHFRFGPVARGGLRWSDRDDYRTEVLGLATTQQKKNVVIVPEGSKGGFYLRNPSADRARLRQEADELYKVFIRGLLDITDNAVGGEPTRPPRVVCHDGMDPYLVVAADKGTAHLSDTANAISQAYGFWLGDAFASGGSNGYDHKKVGITARGAWVLVRRHFAEMGRDPYAEPFTVAGIGDLGGDVFGNGLIETPFARLVAAFNHLHIFLDPNPDAQASHEERLRMFRLGGREAGWDRYDLTKISEGGGVFDRSAKTIPLSPQVRALLDLDLDEASPDQVIHHILKMEVDLLWNGGIGTYVKASFESHADADDRSNDEVRVDGAQLRCKVVGEGGNLGFTQQGRIEAGRHGVRLNTDAIDNSAGVDLSDHEVNLKILLGRIVAEGRLDEPARNALLESLTGEVADGVLENNNAHGRQLSRDQIRSKTDLFQFEHAIAFVERTFHVRRDQLDLPSSAEIAARAQTGEGLSRPELAVLGAYVKMYVYRELMAGDPKAIPGYDDLLASYFPRAVRDRYLDDLRGHMLADEIAMTVATTLLIADGGAALVPIMIETTGASVPQIVTAIFKAQRIARMADVRSTLEELRTSVSLLTLSDGFVRIIDGARMIALYWLSAKGRVPTDDEVARMVPAVDQYVHLQAAEFAKQSRARISALRDEDIPERVAEQIIKAQFLPFALMAWAVSERSGEPIDKTIIKLQSLGLASGMLPIIEQLAVRPAEGSWEPIALRILFIRFLQLLRRVIDQVRVDSPVESVDQLRPLVETGVLDLVRAQIDDILLHEGPPSPATLLVLEERVAATLARST
jgi:glutamate dehydrogenase